MNADLPYDRVAVETAAARIRTDPIALTEADFDLLKTYLGDAVEERARTAQHAAILARVPAVPIVTKAVAAPTPTPAAKAAANAEAIADAITLLVERAIAPMTKAVAALDDRIGALETAARLAAGDERIQ